MWRVLCERILSQSELATEERFSSNSRRVENREILRALIVVAFDGMTGAQVGSLLEEAGIANAQVNDMAGVWRHPQLRARDRWREVDSPSGPLPALLPPATSNAFDARMAGVPDIGQHTDAVLESLGFATEQIAALRDAKAV